MAYGDNISTLTDTLCGLTATEKMRWAEIIELENFGGTDITTARVRMSGVQNGTNIPILLNEDDFAGFPTATTCVLPSCDFDEDFSTFAWDIGGIGCKMELCAEDLAPSFFTFFNSLPDLDETDINKAWVQFLAGRFQRRLKNAMFRVGYLGDRDSTDTLINAFNGKLKQMQALATTSGNLVEIPDNTAPITDGEAVLAIVKEMYQLASTKPWFRLESMKWEMNREMVNALVAYLNTSDEQGGISCGCIDPAKVVGGVKYTADNLTIYGIPVYIKPFTDAMRASEDYYDSDQEEFTQFANIATLEREENDILGYGTENMLEKFNIGYREEDDIIWMTGRAKFGVGIPTDAFVLAI